MFNIKKLAKPAAAFTALMASTSPAWAVIDPSSLVAEIKKSVGPVEAVGLTVLGVIVAVVAIGWLRRAIK